MAGGARHADLAKERLGVRHLGHDLAGVEVSLEAELAGGAEGAAEGTTGLARDAQRRSSWIAHENGLDGSSVGGAEQPLARGPAISELFGFYLEGPERLQFVPHAGREIGHVRIAQHRHLIEPMTQLVDSIRGLALEEVAEILRLVEVGHCQSSERACSIQVLARAPLTPAASAMVSGVAEASLETSSIPASFRRLANTGPIPSMASMPWAVATGVAVRSTGGSGSRDAATEMNRSRIAHTSAAAAPTTPTTLASVFIGRDRTHPWPDLPWAG